ncbi:MAG: hypothetical protein AB8H79_09100 [Myxococcota bacterium]
MPSAKATGASAQGGSAPIVGARSTVVGVPTVGASLLWLRSISAVADHTRTPRSPLSQGAAQNVANALKTAVALDPKFDQAWTDGALVLRVLESGDGPLTQSHRRALSTQRPDLEPTRQPTP